MTAVEGLRVMGEVLPDSDQKSSTTVSPTGKQQALYLTKQAWRRFMIVVRALKTCTGNFIFHCQ